MRRQIYCVHRHVLAQCEAFHGDDGMDGASAPKKSQK